jgi:hypothetical protein
VEAPDDDVEPFGLELACQVLRARELIGLHPYQADDDLRVGPSMAPAQPPRIDARHDLVDDLDAHIQITKPALLDDVVREAVQAAQGVARQGAPPVPDNVAVVVILRRTNQDDREAAISG